MRDRPVVSAPTDETAREPSPSYIPRDTDDKPSDAMPSASFADWRESSEWWQRTCEYWHAQYDELARRETRDDGRPSVGAGT